MMSQQQDELVHKSVPLASLILEAEDLMQKKINVALDKKGKSPVNPTSLLAKKQVEENLVWGNVWSH